MLLKAGKLTREDIKKSTQKAKTDSGVQILHVHNTGQKSRKQDLTKLKKWMENSWK